MGIRRRFKAAHASGTGAGDERGGWVHMVCVCVGGGVRAPGTFAARHMTISISREREEVERAIGP